MRVRAAELSGSETHVQSSRQLVENVKAGRCVFHFDGVEAKLGGQPPHPVHRRAGPLALSPPERMRGDGYAALLAYRMPRGGRGQARLPSLLSNEPANVPLPPPT